MVLYPGLNSQAVAKRHVRYATRLVEDGYTFEVLTPEMRSGAEALARNALDAVDLAPAGGGDAWGAEAPAPDKTEVDSAPPTVEPDLISGDERQEFVLGGQDSGVVALTQDGDMAGVVIVSAVEFGEKTSLFVRALAVEDDHRHQGLATVLLGLAAQVLKGVGFAGEAELVTQTPADLATFFHRAGFAVEEPRVSVPNELAQAGLTQLYVWGADPSWAHVAVKL